MVVNYMESLVSEVLARELEENSHKYAHFKDLYQSPSCRAAVEAYALNELVPFYITGVKGEVYGEYRSKENQNYSDILVAVAKGIEAVMSGQIGYNPSPHAP